METKKEQHKRFFCSFPGCLSAYNKQWKLDAHLCKHTGVKPHSCEHEGCGKSFTSPYHLARHELSHTGVKQFVCTVDGCTDAFTTSTNRNRHIRRIHTKNKYVCKYDGCGLEFNKNKKLKSHVCEQHSQLPPCKCTYEGCQMRFTFPSKLKRHEKVHKGYPCEEEKCDFKGRTWTDLLNHKKEQHKPVFKCDQCSKVLKDSWILRQHQRVHSETRVVFKCPRDDCDRSYTSMLGLKSHVSSFHENVCPFVCTHDGCGKTFALKISLQRHSVIHDPQRKKMTKPRSKRSIASRLSGYSDSKKVVNKKHRNPESKRGSSQATDQPGSVELVSLLQDTSLICSPVVEGLTDAMTAPLTV